MRQPNKVKLTDPYIKSLQAKAEPFLVWDDTQRGLAVRVEKSGFKSWKVIYSRQGRPRWYSLGRVDDIGLAKARKEAAKILGRVANGEDPQADKVSERSSGSFGELAIEYRDHAKKKNKSWEQADDLVTRHLLPKWSKLKPANISRSDVKVVMNRLEATPIQANQVLAAASAIFTWAIDEEIYGVTVNPCSRVKRNDTNSRDRVLWDSEVSKFWNAFNDVGLMEGAVLKTILLTGQRPTEVACMNIKHIVDGWWQLPGRPVAALDWPGTKNGHEHRVWLPQIVQGIVAGLQPTGMVFDGVSINLDKTMRKICETLGMKRDAPKGHRSDNPTPQDLRRTFGTKVTGLGFGRDAMDRILNHKEGDKKKTGKKKTTDVYDRAEYGPQDKVIMEAVAANIMSLIGGCESSNVIDFSKAV